MAQITFNNVYDSLQITINTTLYLSNDEINNELKQLIDETDGEEVTLLSQQRLVIAGDIFSGFRGEDILLYGIVLTRDAVESIPNHVSFKTDMSQNSLTLLKARELQVAMPENVLELSESVEQFGIASHPGNTHHVGTIYCTDNLREFYLIDRNANVLVLNCNNLEELYIDHYNSYVYGDFQEYLSRLKFNSLNYDQKHAAYLAKFKSLQVLDVVGKLQGMTIDDIPDTLNTFNATLLDQNDRPIASSHILFAKPNITTIKLQEKEDIDENGNYIPGSYQVMRDYPHVHFIFRGGYNRETLRAVKNHNKKASSLSWMTWR